MDGEVWVHYAQAYVESLRADERVYPEWGGGEMWPLELVRTPYRVRTARRARTRGMTSTRGRTTIRRPTDT